MKQKLLNIFTSCVLLMLWTVPSLHAQNDTEQKMIKSINQKSDVNERFQATLKLANFYKENNIQKADSIRKVIIEKSRSLEDSLRFKALFYNAEVSLILGDLDDYNEYILACQPFLNKLTDPNIQFSVFRHLGYYHSNMQKYDVAENYLRLSLEQSKAIRDFEKQSESYRYLALNFMQTNQKDSAMFYSTRAINTARRSGSKSTLSLAFNNQALIYEFFGQIELSVAKNFVSLKLAEEVRNNMLLAKYSREIGYSQKLILNLSDAERYFRNSFEYSRRISDRRQMALALTNLANVQLDKKQFEKAIKNSEKSITYLTELNDLNGLGETFNLLGLIYKQQMKYPAAVSQFNQALVYFESTSNKEKIANVYHNVGTVFKEQKKYSIALNYLNRSIDIRKQFGAKNQIYRTYSIISEVYKDIHDVKNALFYMELYLDYVDSNTTVQAATKIAELSESYRAEQRERLITSQSDSIERQQQERVMTATRLENSQLRNNFQMYIIVGFIIIIVMAGLILFYRWNQTKIKQRQKEAEMSQTLLRTQMNPHFVFNAMSVIQSYIYENDTENSSKFLVNFSRLVRLILENSPKEHIPIRIELEILEKYLAMQKLRFQERFEFNIEADEELFLEGAKIPPMITQPFIENAIEHGQLHTIEGGFINISLSKAGRMLKIKIEDNGIGRKGSEATKKSSAHKSMAMNITRDRIENLNKKYKTDGTMIVSDYNIKQETGTKVLISLPYIVDA